MHVLVHDDRVGLHAGRLHHDVIAIEPGTVEGHDCVVHPVRAKFTFVRKHDEPDHPAGGGSQLLCLGKKRVDTF